MKQNNKTEEKSIKPKKIISIRRKKKESSIKSEKRVNEENNRDKSINFSLIEVIVIIVITGLVVSVCSGLIVYNNYDKIFKTSGDNSSSTDLSDFIESYNHIVNSYVKDVDKEGLIDAAIEGMYNYLNDAYSVYIDEDTTETLTERLAGQYEGIGIEITMNSDSKILISRIFSNTPAEKAGLKTGDIITSLDNETLKGKTSNDLASAIKGSDKSSFVIGYERDGTSYEITVKRELVYIDSVSSNIYDKVGYIKIETFSATTSDQVKDKINAFDDSITSLIIDVRDNSGGYLSAAYSTSDLFVNKGDIIYQLKYKDGNIESKKGIIKPIKKFDKIVVLINKSSASASEILAGALKDDLNAILVGVQSYGKGTVQETETLSSGAMVKYTSAYWLTPNGDSINEVGFTPDYEVEEDITTEKDEQLLKAIDLAK